MKTAKRKLHELKCRLGMEEVESDEFIQFVSDVINNMPERWQDPMRRAYLEGKGQHFDEGTGKPLTTDSRYYIMLEHARYGFETLVEVVRENPEIVDWLKEVA